MKHHQQKPGRTLVINGGSSSIKFAMFEDLAGKIVSGSVAGVGLRAGRFTIKRINGESVTRKLALPNQAVAVGVLLKWIRAEGIEHGLEAIGHRFVHGGPKYWETVKLTPKVLSELKRLIPFDPEHLADELSLAGSLLETFPGVPQFACFDTAFHHDLPLVAQRLPIPRKYFKKGVRRYGFHGLSCAYLIQELSRVAGAKAAHGRVIIAHLGNGSSITAVKRGKSMDTSMSLTPTAGIPMGTRAGDLDPALASYFFRTEKMSTAAFQRMVTAESGLLGISETSPDMRSLISLRKKDRRAAEAINLFCYQAKKYICSMAGALGGLETLIFSGGIGENNAFVRAQICAGLEFLGLKLNAKANRAGAPLISDTQSKASVRVIQTDEEQTIADAVKQMLQPTKRNLKL